MTTQTFYLRSAKPADIAGIVSVAGQGQVFESTLRFIFPSIDWFFSEANKPEVMKAIGVCCNADDELLGWASCFRFHERPGYDGVAQFVMDACGTSEISEWGSQLYKWCENECLRQGIRTIISFCHSKMVNFMAWHEVHQFECSGYIDVGGFEKLYAYSKRIA